MDFLLYLLACLTSFVVGTMVDVDWPMVWRKVTGAEPPKQPEPVEDIIRRTLNAEIAENTKMRGVLARIAMEACEYRPRRLTAVEGRAAEEAAYVTELTKEVRI